MSDKDLIVTSRGAWLTLDTGAPRPRTGADMNDLGVREGHAAVLRGDRILDMGGIEDLRAAWPEAEHLDLGDRLVMPGFVDAHTHPVFLATRELEFEMRNQGRSYVEIAGAGGGIRSSVRSLREAGEDELVDLLRDRCDAFLRLGTTTIEAKSGYGLSTEDELKSLRAIKRVAESHALDIIPTFLGAHEVPDEFRDDRDGYIRLVTDEMIPAVAAEGLARYCDVFCESHVFTVDESRRVLEAARKHGLEIRIHADEIDTTGGAELAAEVGAASADHLGAISEEGVKRLVGSGVVPILLPGTAFFLNLGKKAPARRMIDAGLPVAMATDYNPGSCHTRSMAMITTLGCLHYGLSAAEAITAVTVNPAASLGLAEDRGILAPGFRADLIALDIPNARYLPYHFGENLVRAVIKDGKPIHVDEGTRS